VSTVDEIQVDDVLDEVLREEEEAEKTDTGAEEGVAGAEAVGEAAVEEDGEDAADPNPRDHLDKPLTEEDMTPPPGDEELPGLIPIRDLLGIPLYYERSGPPKQFTFYVVQGFKPVLEQTIRETKARVPASFGELERLHSAGAYVGKAGQHGLGRAIDWDRWVFENVEIAPRDGDHAATSKEKRRRYWALGAILRSNSAYLLHGHYDAAHRDHFHFDIGSSVAFATSRSTITLVQAVLNDVFGNNLAIDGNYGPGTRDALQKAVQKVGLTGSVSTVDTWRRFLRRSGRLGFKLSAGR
jgi:hypothetical protein